jgi:hypothetical protein
MKRGLCIFLAVFPLGCVQREMTVVTDPPGAVVYLNDREIGRTPFTRTFLWYGNYDVVVRKEGYQTLKTTAEITAPFWQFVPLDVLTDFLPLTDNTTIRFSLSPQQPADPQVLLTRGEQMQQALESSGYTVHRSVLDVKPASGPVTGPATRPLTGPATGPANDSDPNSAE